MPCMCWFTPEKESFRIVKDAAQTIVNEIKCLEKIGDPIGLSIEDIHKLLDHLYTEKCDEKDV